MKRWYEFENDVSEAVGFNDVARFQDRNGSAKRKAHQHRTPWQLILTLTRKAIAREEKLTSYDQAQKDGRMWELQFLHETGMDSWTRLYPVKRTLLLGRNEDLEYPRQVLDIARYTNDLTQATEWLNVHDAEHQGSRVDKSEWKPARPGWNKLNHSIVVVLPTKAMIERYNGTRPHYNFGPILTAWLAAMAPHSKKRTIVIRQAIQYLREFEHETTVEPPMFAEMPIKDAETMKDWYAFHTLRRLFRMRFGCGMCQHKVAGQWVETPEPDGPLVEFDIRQDKAWVAYKRAAATAMKKYREATS